jgi:two-component system NtrC family sensor kinase
MTRSSPARILIADDSKAVRESVIAALSGLDVAVTTVENGAQALREASLGTYSLLISDIEMPLMNGLQLLRMLRRQFFSSTDLPVIMLTHLAEPEQKVRAFADGANDYVTKPVEPQELLARVKAQLQLRQLQRENLASQAQTLHLHKVAALAQLSATLAHELNTPAQYLSDNLAFLSHAFATLVESSRDNQEVDYERNEIPRSLADMRQGVQRIATIVKAIREFTETDTERVSEVDLPATIDSVVELLQSRWLGLIELTTHYAPDARELRCGRADLKHALWHIIAQAIDDAASATAKGEVDIATTRDDTHVYISVRSCAADRASRKTNPPPNHDGMLLTRSVMQRHHAELTRETAENGMVTAVIKIPS